MQGAALALAIRYHLAFVVQDLNAGKSVSDRVDFVVQCAVHRGYQSNIRNVGRRGGVQMHRAGNACVVEEIEVGQVDALHLLAVLAGFHRRDARVVGAKESSAALVAHGQGAVADTVVYFHFQRHGLAGLGQGGDVRLKGQESAAMGGDLLPVQPHRGVVGHSVKPQHAAGTLWHSKAGTVVGHAVVAAELRVRALVVIGRGHGDGLPRVVGIEAEIPHAVPDAAGSIGLRIHNKHLSIIRMLQKMRGSFPLSPAHAYTCYWAWLSTVVVRLMLPTGILYFTAGITVLGSYTLVLG